MQKKTSQTRDSILAVSERHFAELGYEAASLADIAKEVGIRTPSLYNHFDSKQDLYEAVLKRLLDPFMALLDGALEVDAAQEVALTLLKRVAEHHLRTPNLARLIQHATLAGGTQLEILQTRWYVPVYEKVNMQLDKGPMLGPDWTAEDMRLLVAAFHSIVFGYVTLAPLYTDLLKADPFSEELIHGQVAIVERIMVDLWKANAKPQ